MKKKARAVFAALLGIALVGIGFGVASREQVKLEQILNPEPTYDVATTRCIRALKTQLRSPSTLQVLEVDSFNYTAVSTLVTVGYDAANTTRRTPAPRAHSSTWRVPPRLTLLVRSGWATLLGTDGMAAW